MKVKSFLLTALAASMTFVACDNKDDEMGQLDNTPKSVSIDLSNVIPVTRRGRRQLKGFFDRFTGILYRRNYPV